MSKIRLTRTIRLSLSSVILAVISSENFLYPTYSLACDCREKNFFLCIRKHQRIFLHNKCYLEIQIFHSSVFKKNTTNFYTGIVCKPVDGTSHSSAYFGANSITSVSATSRWKIAWEEQFERFYTDKQTLKEFVTFASQKSQMCVWLNFWNQFRIRNASEMANDHFLEFSFIKIFSF